MLPPVATQRRRNKLWPSLNSTKAILSARSIKGRARSSSPTPGTRDRRAFWRASAFRRSPPPAPRLRAATARAIVDATDLPVSVDFESGFGATANDVAETYRHAAAVGLVGATIEDLTPTRRKDKPLFDIGEATARGAARACRRLPLRQYRSCRRDQALAGLREGGSGRADGAGLAGPRVREGGVRRDCEAVQFHGRYSGHVVHRWRAGSGWAWAASPRRRGVLPHDW